MGERLSIGHKQAWEFRSLGAGLQQNLGRNWGPKLWKDLTVSAPNSVLCSVTDSLSKKVEKEEKNARIHLK